MPTIVDNLGNNVASPRIDWCMTGFGALLHKLRTERGLTQRELGERAGVSENTIFRGESSATCPWRRTAATDVMMALEKRAPLSPEDARQYAELTGLQAMINAVSAVQHELGAPLRELARQTETQIEFLNPEGAKNPELQTVMAWAARLSEERGALNVLTALEGLAAGWGIDLPPRIRADQVESGPRWLKFEAPPREGVQVTMYHPTKPTPPSSPKSTRKAE